jgi:hypothetical protein
VLVSRLVPVSVSLALPLADHVPLWPDAKA